MGWVMFEEDTSCYLHLPRIGLFAGNLVGGRVGLWHFTHSESLGGNLSNCLRLRRRNLETAKACRVPGKLSARARTEAQCWLQLASARVGFAEGNERPVGLIVNKELRADSM